MEKVTIILTGGGTAGHIMPNIALIDELKKHFENIYYIGTNGMEKDIAKSHNIPFFEIKAYKFSRKLSPKLFLLPFRVFSSINQAKKILNDIRPNVIFSKGGYVSIPVAIAGKKLGIPVVTHESDLTMGLANKIIAKYSKFVCLSFYSEQHKNKKFVYTGSPIRKEIFSGNAQNILKDANFDKNLPKLLFVGGSLGAKAINDFVTFNLDELTKKYNILHITGKNYPQKTQKNYKSVPFAPNIQDYFACADIVISRSGANTIFELCAIEKPMLLIPLPKGNSRGDQVENAKYFEKKHLCYMLEQKDLTVQNLTTYIDKTLKNKQTFIQNMQHQSIKNANKRIVDIILNCIKREK